MFGRRPPGPKSGAHDDRLEALDRRCAELQESVGALHHALDATRGHLLSVLQVAVDQEGDARRRLEDVRRTADYAAAFAQDEPLVSILIPTYRNHEGLRTRSIPSALAQDHPAVEVVVVGDQAPDATAEVLASFADPRVRYENLNRRGPYPEDSDGLWFTAGTTPLNRAMELATGSWIAVLNDDDAFRPDFVSRLLTLARRERAEVAYGRLAYHEPGKEPVPFGEFPPRTHHFGWQMALQHGSMRQFGYELSTHLFGEPGDWNRARRMLRTGVRFAMDDAMVCDYYPGRLWNPPPA